MKILIDTNIVLDIVLERQPFVEHSAMLLQTAQQANIEIFLSATTITDLYYIARKAKGKQIALNFIGDLLQFIEIASVNKNVIIQALQSNISDFEDAVQESAAKNEGIKVIVTRNEADFKDSDLELHSPESFLRSRL